MKFTEVDKNSEETEIKFERYYFIFISGFCYYKIHKKDIKN